MKKILIIIAVILAFSASAIAKEDENKIDKVLLQSIEKNELSDITPEFIDKIDKVMWHYHDIGNLANAIKAATYLIELKKSLFGDDNVETAYAYSTRGIMYSWFDVPQKAIKDFEKVDEIIQKNPDDTALKKWQLEGLIHLYVVTEATNKAFDYSNQLFEINKKTKSQKDIYLEQGDIYSVIQDNTNMLKFYDKYSKELNKLKNNDEEKYYFYMKMARVYNNQGKNKLALDYINKAEAALKNINDANNEKKIRLVLLKWDYSNSLGDIKKSKELLDEANALYPTYLDKQMFEELQMLYMSYYKDMKQYDKFKAARKKYEKDGRPRPEESLNYIFENELECEILSKIHNYTAATELAEKTLKELETVKDIAPAYYGKFIRQMFNISLNRKNPVLAKKYFDKMYEIYKQADTEQSSAFIDINKQGGNLFERQHNHEEAIKYYRKALDLAEKYNIAREQADLYGLLGHSYARMGDGLSAIAYADKAVEITKDGNDEFGYAVYMKLLDKYYILNELKRYEEADILFAEIEANQDKITGNQKSFKRSLYNAKAWKYLSLKNYDEAINWGQTALEYADNLWEKEDSSFLLYRAYKANNDMQKAAKYKKAANL